ncbi:MAG TPA: hypothetical protein HA347_04130 [Nitrosopumilus sp.]|mgnify:FL=1|jgi:hypothetical protein|nr:hypothetical protein [Nitrosopumilus sp.]
MNYPDDNILMKFFITFGNLNFESLKKLSLGKKIVIATVIAIVAQAFGIIFL